MIYERYLYKGWHLAISKKKDKKGMRERVDTIQTSNVVADKYLNFV
jgi:hypothetical protein